MEGINVNQHFRSKEVLSNNLLCKLTCDKVIVKLLVDGSTYDDIRK